MLGSRDVPFFPNGFVACSDSLDRHPDNASGRREMKRDLITGHIAQLIGIPFDEQRPRFGLLCGQGSYEEVEQYGKRGQQLSHDRNLLGGLDSERFGKLIDR